jgi:hypothetical protein
MEKTKRAILAIPLLSVLGGMACSTMRSSVQAPPSAPAEATRPAPAPAPAVRDARDARDARDSHDAAKACPGIVALLGSLRGPMSVDAYVTRGLPALDSFVAQLDALLSRYQKESAGHLTHRIIDVRDDATRKKAKSAGLVEQPFEAAAGKVSTQGFMGLVFKYGGHEDVIKFLPPDRPQGIDYWIANKVRELHENADGIHRKIGVLTGHDEIRPGDENLVPGGMGRFSMQGIITDHFHFYSFVNVDLKNGDADVPDDVDGLVVTQPGKDLNDNELRRIDRFVMKGKSLAVFASAVNVKAGDATMNASLGTHGLGKLLAGYGIAMNDDVVVDAWRHVRVNVQTASGLAKAELPQVLDLEWDGRDARDAGLIDDAFPALFRVEELSLPFASSLTLKADAQPAAKMRVVLRSSPVAVRLTGPTADLRPFQAWASKTAQLPQQPLVVGAAVEGTLRSAFPDGGAGHDGAPVQSAKPARVFVLSSSQFLANPLARAGGEVAKGGDEQLVALAGAYAQQYLATSILAFKNTLDWLTLSDALVDC